MRFRKSPHVVLATLSLILTVSGLAFAKGKSPQFPNVKIKNFGQMDERFYRGARPKDEDYKLPQPQTTKPKAIASNDRAAQI